MKRMKETIGRLAAGSLRWAALAVAIGLAGSAWAATAPSITVDGANVTVHNDNGTQWDNAGINTMSSYQDTTFTIPSGTDLAAGTKVLVSTISIGASSSQPGNLPAKLSLTVGGTTYVSKTATVTAGGFTSSGKNKHTYSFDGKYCILTVDTAASLKWINEDGSELQGFAAFGLVKDGHQFITRIKWSTSVPVTEVTGKIVTVATGALTDIYNTDTTPKCLQDATGWISTATASTGEIILLNGSNGYGLRLTNGNSLRDNSRNTFSVWPKLSGNGTLTTGDNNWQTPALKIYDASDFTGSINASAGNIYLAVIFCAENDTFSPSVYEEIGSKSGLIYIKSGTSVTVAEGATWTAVNGIVNKGSLTVNGTVASAISNVGGTVTVNGTVASAISNVGGTVTVNAGATLASFGSVRDFTGFAIDSSVPVKVTMSEEEYGKGLLSISGASGISSITVLAPDGTTVVTTLTPENGAAAYNRGTVLVSGKACWCDYEMDYESGIASKTGFQNTGTESTGLHEDSSINGDNAFYNGMLYTYAHPYRDPITYPSDGNWTAVVRCTVPAYENAAVITFGTRGGGLIGLVAGADPETQMRLVQTTGNSHFITNATMTVQNATTAQHVYIFSVENNQTVKVYCDGDLVLNKTFDSQFSIGNGLQIGSVCGGVGATGIIRFAKGESPANTLSETVQKNARIDCVRLYNYIISPEQVAQLSVEFPAVKLYRATVAGGATTDWGSLTWTPGWDGGNTSSKIILTVEGDAALTLTNSITADEFVINVPSDNVLTLSKFASGTTLNVTKPIEVSGGTVYFNPGFNNSIGLGDLNFGGTGTVRLGNGIIVTENISGAASVELLSGVSAIIYGGAISNPLKGVGLLDYTYDSLPSGLSFGDWTGTVRLPEFTADALNLNNYGKSGSTVEIMAINGGWIAEAGKTVAPTLKLSGNMTINAMSSWTYTFAEITGGGNLSFSTSANSPTVNITKVAEGYSGTISSTLSDPVTIATLDRAAETPVTAGSKLLGTSSGVQASALTLAGVATSITPVFDTDGLYVKAASVTKNDTTTNYDTVSAALTAAGNDAATIKLLMPTDSAVALAPGQTLVNGNLTSGGVTGPNGYEVVNNNGTYTLVDNTASTWAPGDGSDNSWNTGANWSTGYKPTQYTAVTFPANVDGWTVGIPGNAGNEKCASMTLDGDVTFQRGGNDWAKLCVYGAISGEGTLTLNQTCIENDSGSVITIPGPVVIVGSNDSAFLGANGWTIAGDLSVDGYFKTQIPITVTGDAVFAASGAKVETQSAITITGTTTLNGDFSRDTTYGDAQLTFGDVTVAASTTITGAKPTTFAGTVTLAGDATLTVPTATTTVADATFEADDSNSYVKSEISDANTVYSLETYKTVTFFDEDGTTVLQTASNYKLGDTVTAPADPTKTATAQYTYTFAGWTPAFAETVTGDATYTATYSSTVNEYTITWVVDETSDTTQVAYGTVPTYTDPVKQYYTFTGWDPTPVAVTGSATYTATFSRNTVTVTVPTVENATVSVQYTTGGVSSTGTEAGTYTVDAGTSVTVTYTAAEGYYFGGSTTKEFNYNTVTEAPSISVDPALHIYLDQTSVEVNYNGTVYISVVGAPEEATYSWSCEDENAEFDLENANSSTVEITAWGWTTPGDYIFNVDVTIGGDTFQLSATVTVVDVAAVVDGTPYTVAEIDDAINTAISTGEVLELYYDDISGEFALAADQVLRVKAMSDWVFLEDSLESALKGPANTVETCYVIESEEDQDGVVTYSVGEVDTAVEYKDGTTVQYYAELPRSGSVYPLGNGTYKLFKDLSVGNRAVEVSGTGAVTLDLNGNTIYSTRNNTQGAISLPLGATLTICDSVGGGGLETEGNYLIGIKNASGSGTITLNITGGRFVSSNSNIRLTNDFALTITGGSFSNFTTISNYVPEGYVAVADTPETGWYTVMDRVTVTLPAYDSTKVQPTVTASAGNVTDNGDGTYLVQAGSTVTITWTAVGANIVTSEAQVIENVTSNVTADSVTAPTVVPAVAVVGGVYKATLAEAIGAAQAGDTVALIADCTADAAKTTAADRLVVTKAITIDFGAYTYSVPGSLEPTANWCAIYIDANTTVTGTTGGVDCLDKEDPSDKCGVYAFNVREGAKLTIAGGHYHGGGTIVQAQLGTVEITGGTFTVTPFDAPYGSDFAFNCVDASYQAGDAGFSISGGTFVGFDPQDNKSEGAGTDYTADGFVAIDDGEGTFTVVEGYNVTYKNGDTVLETYRVAKAEPATPAYAGETPVKPADELYTYTFAGWDPAVAETVTEDATYAATFTPVAKYTTFTVAVPENTTVTVTGATLVEGNTYRADAGAEVTITYAASGAYVASGTKTQKVTPTANQTVEPPSTYTVVPATVEFTNPSSVVTYYTESNLNSLNNGTYKLLADVTRTQRMAFGTWASSVTLDLNGFTLTSTASDCAITLGRAGTAAAPKVFNLVDTSTEKGGMLAFTTTPSSTTSAIRTSGKYNQVTIGEGVTVTGGCILMSGANQTLTVYGTVNGGEDFAIASQGDSTKDLTLTVAAGATVTSSTTAIYLPGTGTATIAGTVTGATGVEVRSGTLNVVDGAEITAIGAFSEAANGSGTTVVGAAVAVSQHTTKNPISVTVSGGTLTGAKALYETDVQNGEGTTGVAMAVTGGTFVGAVESDDVTGFISGGTFDAEVSPAYCAAGYEPKDNGDGTYGVQTAKVEVEVDEVPTTTDPVTVLVAVPQACAADELIDTANRAEGDILKAYVKGDDCFYTWELDSTKAWQPKETYKVDESGATVSSKPAAEVNLTAGQSVWVTIKTDETIKLLLTYNPEPVAVEVDTGWNMVAPTTPGGTTVKEIAETSGATVKDAIVVPTKAAPKVYTKDETTGEWGFADIQEVVVETVTGTKKRAIPFHNTADTTIKAGKGVWFVNGGNTKEINL